MKDVMIVGAGFAGLTLGLWCQRAGASVTVVDRGVTPGSPQGLSAAPVTVQQGLLYHHVERWHGRDAAESVADALSLAVDDARGLIEELAVAATPIPVATATDDGHEAFWLRYESMAMRRVGFEPEFDDTPRLPWDVRPYPNGTGLTVDVTCLRDHLLEAFIDAGGTLSETLPPKAGTRISATPWPVSRGALVRSRLRRTTWRWAEVHGLELDRAWNMIDHGEALLVPQQNGSVAVGTRSEDPLTWLAARGVSASIIRRWDAATCDSVDALPFVGHLRLSGAARRSTGQRAEDLVMAGFGPWELTLGMAAARQVFTHLSTGAEFPWTPQRLVRLATVGRTAWGATRHAWNLNTVTPFPKAPRFRTRHSR